MKKLSTGVIIGLSFLGAAIVAGIIAIILYFFAKTTTTIIDLSQSPSPQPPSAPPPGQLSAPAFRRIDVNPVAVYMTTPIPGQTPILCMTPSPFPTHTPANYFLTLPLRTGRFAASTFQGHIVAIGDMEGESTNWCRQVYFLNTATDKTKGTTTLQINGNPVNFGAGSNPDQPQDRNNNTPWDLIGIMDDRLDLITIQDIENPTYAFVSAQNMDSDEDGILIFKNGSTSWDVVKDSKNIIQPLQQHPGPIPGEPFGDTIYFKNYHLFVRAKNTPTTRFVQVFKVNTTEEIVYIQDIQNPGSDSITSPSFGVLMQATKLSIDGTINNDQLFISTPNATVSTNTEAGIIYSFMYDEKSAMYIHTPGTDIAYSDPQTNQHFGQSLYVNDSGTLLITSITTNSINQVLIYHRSDITTRFQTLLQTINYPQLTGYNAIPASKLVFGSRIHGVADGRIIVITTTDYTNDKTSAYNKIYIYAQNTTSNLFIETGLQPQIFGSNFLYGTFLDVQLLSDNIAQLLVGNPQIGELELYSYKSN